MMPPRVELRLCRDEWDFDGFDMHPESPRTSRYACALVERRRLVEKRGRKQEMADLYYKRATEVNAAE